MEGSSAEKPSSETALSFARPSMPVEVADVTPVKGDSLKSFKGAIEGLGFRLLKGGYIGHSIGFGVQGFNSLKRGFVGTYIREYYWEYSRRY